MTPNRDGIESFKKEEEEEERRMEKKDDYDISTIEGYEILKKMNETFSKSFKNADFIINLLRQGKKKEDFLKIIYNKKNDPFFKDNQNLYNPITLFKKEHYEKYLNENRKNEEVEKEIEKKEKIREDTDEEKQKFFDYLIEELPLLQTEIYKIIFNYGIDELLYDLGLDFFDDIACYKIENKKITFFPRTKMFGKYHFVLEAIKSESGYDYEYIYRIPDIFKK